METKSYILGQNGMEEIKKTGDFEIGARFYSFGAGMSDNIWSVISENKLVKMSKLYHDDYFSSPYHNLDGYERPISKKFGIGFYYDDLDTDFKFSEDEIKEAIKKADDFIIEQKRIKEDQKIKKEKEISILPGIYPHLKPITDKYNQKEVKYNLVADLKHNFPNVKFSVRKEHYDTYNVSWLDGPTQEQVSKVSSKFESYSNDITGDYRDYSPSNFNEVFGGFKYVFENRNYSENIYSLFSDDFDLNRIIHNTEIPENFISCEFINNELIFTLPEKQETQEIKDVKIIDYSEKAIAVIGDTKPIKDKLKAIGGRFNFRLSCGAGWIFPKTKKNDVELLLSSI